MKITFRNPSIKDVKPIHLIAQEFYQGYETNETILTDWITNSPKQFVVVEIDEKIEGCIFWEYLDEIKALPYFHKTQDFNSPQSRYAYVSEIVISKKYKEKGLMWLLYGAMEISLKKIVRELFG